MAPTTDSEDSNPKPSPRLIYPDIIGVSALSLSECVLYAPSLNGPPPTTREKPPGCKTIFVGGLPENTTEEMMLELFGIVGDILTVRMSLKNFCHIRFVSELFADRAIMFSGYRIKINDKDDAPNTGRLHVDYAEARDDQYEFESRKYDFESKTCNELENEDNTFRPPTPPAKIQYTDREAIALSAKLRDSDTFEAAINVLISWLERGVCTKKNVGYFFSMIQSTTSHVHRLRNEKIRYENQLNEAKLELQDQIKNIVLQLDEINKVFSAANVQKSWDHFTKPQRRNILQWKEELEKIKTEEFDEIIEERVGDEMDLSDSENGEETNEVVENTDKNEETVSVDEVEKMREENDLLRSKLQVVENEVALARSELEGERADKDRQIKLLCQNIQNVYKNSLPSSDETFDDNLDIASSAKRMRRSYDANSESSRDSAQECSSSCNIVTSSSGNHSPVTDIHARYIGLVSTFLSTHPFGANIDYICSYLNEFDHTVNARDLEVLMERFPVIFQKQCTGIGASLEKKWTFCGFDI